MKKAILSLLLMVPMLGMDLCAQVTEQNVSSVYVGGHIRRERPGTITKLRNSGFQTVILFNVHVDTDGTLMTDGETICKDGVYVFNKTQPNYVNDIKNLKKEPTGVERIEICIGGWGNDSYKHIKDLIDRDGTGEETILYRNFKALHDMIPEIDAVNNDQEQDYDANNTIKFHKMMHSLGWKTTIAPYTNKSFWQTVATGLKRYGLDRILIQCYDGGAGNVNYARDWHLLSDVPLHAGLLHYGNDWNMNTNRSMFEMWRDQHEVTGGFVWVYNDETWDLNDWASSINRIYKARSVDEQNTAATVYSDANYGGYAINMPEGEYKQSEMAVWGIKIKEISSVKVNEGYKVTLYTNTSCGGNGSTYETSTADLGTYNNKACSLKIEKVDNGVETIVTDTNNEAQYFDLSGRRVSPDHKGIIIKKQGEKTTKIHNS